MISSILNRKGREVATISPGESIKHAVERLAELHVGALVVSKDGQTIDGILSERDIVRSLAVDHAATLSKSVADLMTAEVTTCKSTNTTSELMEIMTNRRIRHVPVVDDGRLGGIVSIGDVVSKRLRELEEERQQMEEYIKHG